MQKGVGGAKLYAAIGVTYPKGAVLTCANADGSKVFTAETTDGEWVFAIPENGKWTVACGNKTAEVNITEEGQFEKVTITFELVLFDGTNGGDNTAVTGGWASSATDGYQGGNRSSISNTSMKVRNGGEADQGNWYGGTSTIKANNKIDVTNYNTCTFVVSQKAGSNRAFSVGGATKSNPGTGTNTLDISSVSGEVDISFTATRGSSTWSEASMTVTKIVLS